MTFKPFKKQFINESNIKDEGGLVRALNNLQVNIAETFQPLISKTQNDSVILLNISLLAGQINTVNHLLNRKLTGWSIIDLDANATIWRVQKDLNDNLILYLRCSANCTISLEVF